VLLQGVLLQHFRPFQLELSFLDSWRVIHAQVLVGAIGGARHFIYRKLLTIEFAENNVTSLNNFVLAALGSWRLHALSKHLLPPLLEQLSDPCGFLLERDHEVLDAWSGGQPLPLSVVRSACALVYVLSYVQGVVLQAV